MLQNPFRPNFGQVPARMAGREQLIADLTRALDDGPGNPYRTTIVIGARGTGKTALLTYMSSLAGEHGWLSVDTVCREGLLDDVLLQARKASSHLLDETANSMAPSEVSASLSVGGFGGGVSFRKTGEARFDGNWRLEMENLLDELDQKETGLFITIDEVDPSLPEMIDFASVYQLFVRAERPVMLLMAGLPHRVSQLLSDKSVSFLRRACQQHLWSIPDYEVEDALRRTVEAAGKSIDSEALTTAAAAVEGFPFMLQLVGYRSWEASEERSQISMDDTENGIELARHDMEMRVLKTTLDELSDMAIRFLQVMLVDDSMSTSADIAQRLGKKLGYVSSYKRRLMESGVIEEAGRGRVRFALPCLREYLPRYIETYL